MTTLAEFMILSGGDNRPPMLDKDLYDSWKSRMELYKQNIEHGRMILESVEHGPLIWPTIKENGVTRTKKYEELFATEKIQADCDLKATNIILQGLPSDFYSLVNTKSLNSLPPEWSKFMTDVKLVRDLHTTNFDQLNAYLEQHELHANKVPSYPNAYSSTIHQNACPQPQSIPQIIYTVSIVNQQTHLAKLPQIDSGLAVLVFKQGDDPIDAINKMMSFLSTVITSRFPYTNNQLRNPSNPRQQESIHDGRVTVQLVYGRQNSFAASTSGIRANISETVVNNSSQQRVVKCFNCQGEAQGSSKVLNEEELEFLADRGVAEAKAVLMANLSSYRSDVLSEVPHSENTLNDMLNQSVQEMLYFEQTHLVNYLENEITIDSNIILYSQYLLETQNAAVQDTNSSAQQDAMILSVFEQLSNQVTNCNKVNKDNLITNESLSGEIERYKEWVKLLEERQNVELSTKEKLIIDDIIWEKNAQFMDFEKEINSLKQTLSEQLKEKELLTETFNKFKELDNIVYKMGQSAQTVHMLTKPQVFYDNNLKQALGFQNLFYLKKAQQIRPMLYDGSVIAKETNVISIADSEETLMLEGESRSKMLLKQSDPMVLENKVNIKPINYAELNRLSEDFGKRFISQQELSDEQAFGLQTSHPNTDQSASSPIKIKALRELPTVRLVNTSLKKLKYHLGQFDSMVKKRSTTDALTEGEWGFEHTKAVFLKEIIPFLKTIKDIFNVFDKDLLNENNTSVNQTKPTFDQLFELNNLKAELQVKDTTIEKLKANIKRLNKTSTTNSVKKDIDEIETINIELEHRVAKLIAKNKHLKQTYKQLYDSIKPSRICAKEHTESLVNQLNQKSVEITDLNAQLQEKLNPVTLAPKDKNNREAHIYYLKHTMEQAVILREIVEQAKSLNPLDSASYSACNRSTISSRSKSTDNTKNDRILQISSSTQKKNKVEDHSRIVNSMFDARHKLCFLEFVFDMNACSKSKSVKKAKKKEEWKPTGKVVQIVLWYLDLECSKHMTGDHSQLTNFVYKFLDTVKFGNDQIAKIIGYADYQIRNITISRVYFVEGVGHNLFSVGQFCDSDLEVAFRKHTCFVRNLEGVDLLSGSQETNLYTLSIRDMMVSSPICLLSKASKTKSWLWHRRSPHLNFGAINHLAKNVLVRGLPKSKFEKDHLCSACAMGKSKKQSHKPKYEDTNREKLYLLHMDLCGPMRVASVNGKKYIFVIVDDYSRFTWVKFLASKDEAPDFIIKFLKMIQVRLNATVRNIRTDNETEFINQTLCSYYESVGLSHETSVARSPQQNGVVERQNRTLVEAARTMLIYAKAPLFLWAEALVFDEFFSPPASFVSTVLAVEAPAPVKSTSTPSSTLVDQDAPYLSTPRSTQQSQSQEIPFSAEEESHDLEVAHMSNDPYFGILIPETISEESSSSDVIPTIVHSDTPIS
ncbi:retrovirus-related pol polyprotein from transposon TNT 1-94 [Tanacetum coccineum]|uniref:Retrovirus-related pol polyprotein from transposon TNT 1-94 n=1 Tax=Tanacetum coccineum TaxID=301880 RepID=A0ABQ4Z6R4_9ASTR